MPRTTSITENKKKLGKNLNKLVVKPTAQSTGSQQQRNGLLLLSAQKKSSGGLLASSNKSSSPTASTVASPSQQPHHHHSSKAYEATKTSTHDALLSAVSGAKSDRGGEQAAAPDAWGVAGAAEKQQQQQRSSEVVNIESTTPTTAVANETTTERGATPETATTKTEASDTHPVAAIAGPNWDEYGGRGSSGRGRLLDVGTRERVSTSLPREQVERVSHRELGAGELWEPSGSASYSRTGADGGREQDSASSSPGVDSEQPPATSAPVMIHLKNYEDRDRGERPNSSAPRMLYDPKSGSMVEVKEKEERKKARGRKRRERSVGWSAARKAEKAEVANFPDGNTKTDVVKSSKRQDNGAVLLKKKNHGVRERRHLPRTCGVLYERDEKGQICCADGCEGGDLGYGAHSVPGGRARNRGAYRQYLMYQEELARNDVNEHDEIDNDMGMVDFGGGTHVYSMYNSSYRVGGRTDASYDAEDHIAAGEVALQTGYHPTTATPELAPMEWVRAGDKLELVTGIDDSPTLKPTAKEWAPSHAALAAARAAASRGRNVMSASFDSEEDEAGIEEAPSDDEDSTGAFGLGFDPAKHMDGLMQSPSHTGGDMDGVVASVDLDALNLEPPMFQNAAANDRDASSGPGHIFAFGTSGTWGSKAPTGSSTDDWGVAAPTSSTGNYASTFLSLSTGKNTWGLPGMGGLSSNGDSSVGKGDLDE